MIIAIMKGLVFLLYGRRRATAFELHHARPRRRLSCMPHTRSATPLRLLFWQHTCLIWQKASDFSWRSALAAWLWALARWPGTAARTRSVAGWPAPASAASTARLLARFACWHWILPKVSRTWPASWPPVWCWRVTWPRSSLNGCRQQSTCSQARRRRCLSWGLAWRSTCSQQSLRCSLGSALSLR